MSDGNPLCQQFQDDVNTAIDKYRDQGLTLAEAIGVLEVAKLDLWLEAKREYIRDIAGDPGLA